MAKNEAVAAALTAVNQRSSANVQTISSPKPQLVPVVSSPPPIPKVSYDIVSELITSCQQNNSFTPVIDSSLTSYKYE